MIRDSRVRYAVWPAGFIAASCLVGMGACSSSSSQEFGPTFDATPDDQHAQGDTGSPIPITDSGATDGAGDNDGEASAPCPDSVYAMAGNSGHAYGAVWFQGTWTASALGTATMSSGALAKLGSNYIAVIESAAGDLSSSTYNGTAWSAPAAIGTATARDLLSVATLGTTLHLAYQDPAAFTYFHAIYDGANWSPTADPVSNGGTQSLGAEPPAITAVGTTEIVLVNGGSADGPLFDQSWKADAWGAGTALPSGTAVCGDSGTCGGQPAVITLSGGGANDVMAFFLDKATRQVFYATRASASGTWTANGTTNIKALTNGAVHAALVAPTQAVITFQGQNGNGYGMVADLSFSPPKFADPVQLGAGVGGAPLIAKGVCGDAAIAVFTIGNADARASRLRGSTWTAPEVITGTAGGTGATFAAVATE